MEPGGETVGGVRPHRPARRGARGGWRVRRAKERESGDHLTATPGVGAPEGLCRKGRQPLPSGPGPPQPNPVTRILSVPARLSIEQTQRAATSTNQHQEPRSHADETTPIASADQNCNTELLNGQTPGPVHDKQDSECGNLSLELLNVQSLLPKLPDIRADVCNRSPDMLCYTETNLKSATPNRLASVVGYSLFRQDRKIGRKKSGGGVAIYIKENLSANKIKIKITSSNSHLETLWVKVKFDKKKVAAVACAYRPPSSNQSQIDADFDDLEEQIQQVISNSPSHRIIIAGDLNADPQTNPKACSRLQELHRYGLECAVNEPTFYCNSTRSILDVVLLSSSLCNNRTPVKCSIEQCDYASHHRRVRVEVRVPRTKQKAHYKTGRGWRNFDSDSFLNDVKNIEWQSIVKQNETCEKQWKAFSSVINTLLDRHAPIRKFRVHNPRPPPVSQETRNLMMQRRRARATKSPMYQEINTLTKRAIRRDCRDDVANRVRNSKPSSLFQQIKHIIAPKRGPATTPENLTADDLNEYFTSVGAKTRNEVMTKFNISGQDRLPPRLPRVNAGSMRITPVTLPELKNTLFALSNKDSSIQGDIPIKILKLIFSTVGRYLLRIINKSFVSETVPPAWKKAVVIPLFKRDDPAKASNFRPITKVPGICKVVEKLVHKQLTRYIQSQNLMGEDQHGFRSQHSTCTALLTMTDEILRGMDQSHISLLALIDLSRCFDVIDHETLLNKLEMMQISTGWFRSYLHGHMQQVKVGESYSKPLPITIGTFQGTCLGPLLYNIASNDLASHIPDKINGFKVTTVRYADDTQIAVTGPREKLTELQESMENLLGTMSTWFQQHGMKVNAAKTELLLCGDSKQLKQIKQPLSLSVMGEQIQFSKIVRNLGVFMDETLSWNNHIKIITDRCFGIMIGLSHIKHVIPAELLPRIVDCLVLSHVRYCVQVYGSASTTSLKSIQKIFNFAARIISGRKKYDHISEVLLELGWPKVEDLVRNSDLRMLNKVRKYNEPSSLASLIRFNHELVQRDTRQSNHLALPLPRNNHGKRTFLYRASKAFNTQLSFQNQ